jgi:hypothetical protein
VQVLGVGLAVEGLDKLATKNSAYSHLQVKIGRAKWIFRY